MRKEEQKKSKRGERGQAMVEVTLLCPWIFFLFVGILDFGFYSYAAICTQNAARAAAIQTATGVGAQADVIACNAALYELNRIPNVVGVTACNALPVQVVRQTLCIQASVSPTMPCDATGCADCGVDPKAASSKVAVTYQSTLYIPIPGILTNQLNLTRIAEARVIAE